MKEMMNVVVVSDDGLEQVHEFPTDMGLSLMEALKAANYPVEAVCGGLALCATCRVDWLEGIVTEPTDAELDMLDTLPDQQPCHRLACQIRLDRLVGQSVKIRLNPSKS
jgi:2Fe-2S ferredoxin